MNGTKNESKVSEDCLDNKLGKVLVISLATSVNNKPFIRKVFGFYHNKVIYAITYVSSKKIKQIKENSNVGLGCHRVFYANGVACIKEYEYINDECYDELKRCFSKVANQMDQHYINKEKCIMCIQLNEGIVIEDEKEYEFKFNLN